MEGLILIVLMAHEQLHGVETYSPKLIQETTYSVVRHLNYLHDLTLQPAYAVIFNQFLG
jgi:hypothetical protein